jgi:hypothetical protein
VHDEALETPRAGRIGVELTARRARVLLIGLFAVSAVIRVLVDVQRDTPLYYADEYIYSAIARSIADTGQPDLRGSAWHFPSLLGPYLMAPFWLIDNVGRAYHAIVAFNGVCFSAAVFPAYALARRVGITPGGGLVVALLAVLVPDAAFATCALTEAYAYPLFLVTVLVSVDAVVRPTRLRQLSALLLMAALCLLRAQFAVMPAAYVLAVFLRDGASVRKVWRSNPAVILVAVIGVIAAVFGARYYTGLGGHWRAALSIWPWLAIDLLTLAIAAGWVIVPGAVLGARSLLSSSDQWRRTFAVLSIGVSVLIVLEAAYFDAIQHRIHERYTFYAAPLLAIACVYAFQLLPRGRSYTLIGYGAAVAAIAIPATTWYREADPVQAPTILGLQIFGTGIPQLVGVLLLSVLALGIARLPNARLTLAGAVIVAGAFCIAGTHVLIGYSPNAHPGGSHNIALYELGAPAGSSLVTGPATDKYVLMKSLFWTRSIDRVLVLGGGPAADTFGSTPVFFGRRGFVDAGGRPARGPFAFDLTTTVLPSEPGAPPSSRWLRGPPAVLALGLNRYSGDLSTSVQLFLAPSEKPRSLLLVLRSVSGPKQLTLICGNQRTKVDVGSRPVSARVPVDPHRLRTCRLSLTRGTAEEFDGEIVSGVRIVRFSLVDRPETS